ncbi:MAG: hypothetical protein H6623_07765 [Bdellovibrionaceae bacterium]|nr:hypothetical protein [Pseudobdellovibrionaceae bacterium]
MSSVLLFAGRSLLDKPGIRTHLLRIPEVSATLREAQRELDTDKGVKFDLVSFIQSEDKEFHSMSCWKDLVVQLIQVGLYKRLQKSMVKPKFLVGRTGNISAMDVCLGKQSLKGMVQTFKEQREQTLKNAQNQDTLVGQSLELFNLYVWNGDTYLSSKSGKSAESLIEDVMKDHLVYETIALGLSCETTPEIANVTVVESLILDPLLNWIVPHLKSA